MNYKRNKQLKTYIFVVNAIVKFVNVTTLDVLQKIILKLFINNIFYFKKYIKKLFIV